MVLSLKFFKQGRWVFTSPCVGSSSTWNDLHGGWATIQGHRFFPGQAGSFSWLQLLEMAGLLVFALGWDRWCFVD
jgi:hypothetical protein